MRPAIQSGWSVQEYLAFERRTEERHEYLAGELFAMGGASERHNLIVTNLVRELSQQLKRQPCKTYPTDMRVRVAPSGLYTYPDIVVVCGEARFDDEQRDTLLNPALLVEVLSPSTEAYDRGDKFEHYRKLDSLAEYLLVSQDRMHVEQFVRQRDGQWLLSESDGRAAVVRLSAVDVALSLIEMYDKVDV
ncbi:MAG: Uma2 family endonuclease [bacterium]